MKKTKFFRLVVTIVMAAILLPMPLLARATEVDASTIDESTHDHENNSKVSVLVKDVDGNDVLAFVSDEEMEINDVLNAVAYALVASINDGSLEFDSESSGISSRVLVCCEPNKPKRTLFPYTHYYHSSSTCKAYQQTMSQCTKCGAIVGYGALVDLGTHRPGSAYYCPY